MPFATPRLKRAGTRLTALAVAAPVAAVAFAAPAAAAEPAAPAVDFQVESTDANARYDYNGDGFNDLVYLTKPGALSFRAGDGAGNLGAAQSLPYYGLGKMDIVMAGDLTGDGFPDLRARNWQNTYNYIYPGDGAGGFGTRIEEGYGALSSLFTVLDCDGDADLETLRMTVRYNGELYCDSTKIGIGYNDVDMLVTAGDVDQDGIDDFLLRTGSTQEYELHLTGSEEPVVLDTWLGDPTQSHRYSQVVGVGDLDGNGSPDLLTVDSVTGALFRQSFSTSGSVEGFTALSDGGWNGYRLPAVVADTTFDYNMDGRSDLLARRNSNDYTYVYRGTGTGGVGETISWGSQFSDLNLFDYAGDFTGDGRPDMIGRVALNGWLYVYPGNGTGGVDYDARVRIGTGWNIMDTIVSGSDFNRDGITDIIARETGSNTLWLYPGKGNGKVGARTSYDSGGGLKNISTGGDFNHDGYPDLLAIRTSDNCLMFYRGQGISGFKRGLAIDCGWAGKDIITGVGDFNGDFHDDFVTRRESDGAMILYRGTGYGGFQNGTIFIGSGWNAMDLIA